MLGLDIRLVLAYLINVAILFIFLRLVLYKPVRKFLKERELRFVAQREDIDAEKQAAQATKEQYDTLLQTAHDEGAAVIRDSRSQANQRAEAILSEARQQAVDIVERARREVAEERRVAKQAMHDEIANLAVEIAAKILEREVSAQDSKNIIEQFLHKERIG
ncbi:MAG: F0F1 ATP synthase subunit B [Eubacteriales bacterium]|nr:F0F1 ATP synthase subunit B [Eubacteriales bacterium]